MSRKLPSRDVPCIRCCNFSHPVWQAVDREMARLILILARCFESLALGFNCHTAYFLLLFVIGHFLTYIVNVAAVLT